MVALVFVSDLLLACLAGHVVSGFAFSEVWDPGNATLDLIEGTLALLDLFVVWCPLHHFSDRTDRFFILLRIIPLLLPLLRQLCHLGPMAALCPPLFDHFNYWVRHLENNVSLVRAGVERPSRKF